MSNSVSFREAANALVEEQKERADPDSDYSGVGETLRNVAASILYSAGYGED